MARGRMIDRELFCHEKLMDLDIRIRYFYVGLIVYADDEGRIKANPKYLKAKIFPGDFLTENDLIQMLKSLSELGIILVYQVVDTPYIQHPKWTTWQKIRSDRLRPSDCPPPNENASLLITFNDDNQMSTKCQPDVNQMATQVNISKVKLSKDKSTKVNEITPYSTNVELVQPFDSFKTEPLKPPPLAPVPPVSKKKETDIQKIVKGWKMLTSVPIEGPESRAWDSVHFPRHSRAAKSLLALFGDWQTSCDAMEYVYMTLTAKKLSCTIETIVKHSDLYREYKAGRIQ